MSRALPAGAMLGEAACLFERAYQNLVAGVLRYDAAGLEPSEEVGGIIEAVADLSAAALQLADDYGQAAVPERLRRYG